MRVAAQKPAASAYVCYVLKDVQNPIRTPLLLVSVFAIFGTAVSVLRDGQTGPVSMGPTPNSIVAGGSTTLEITLNQAASTNTVVSLSSSSPYLSVPASVTIPAGETVGYTTGVSSTSEPSEAPTLKAAANGQEADCTVLVTAVAKSH